MGGVPVARRQPGQSGAADKGYKQMNPPGRCSLHCFDSSVFAAIAGFHASLLRLIGVGQDGFDLLFAEFDFHDSFGF
jgi:hypothetical protein